MIKYVEGNLLESKAGALVNTVNTVGVMGKGIALQFKILFPNNYKLYKKACKESGIGIGNLFVTEEENLISGKKIIINFPTKTDWKKPSDYAYIEKGLTDLKRIIETQKIKSIALPPLGAGNGGLDWNKVRLLIENSLSDVDAEILIYQPNTEVREILNKELVKLTPSRAMLLSVLYDLVKNGEFVSEFSAEKIAYFLQKFGAKEHLKLSFKPNFYGPYSGKVKHVLYYLNGSYISGYSSKDKKPFEEIGIDLSKEQTVTDYLSENENKHLKEIADKTKSFLSGFYSSFGLELLSTIDFISNEKKTTDLDEISKYLNEWSERKKTMFSNPKFMNIALDRIKQN